jgi:hypothetical protein
LKEPLNTLPSWACYLRVVFSNSSVVLVVSLVVVVVVVVFSSSSRPEICLGAETGRTIVHLLLSSPSSASFSSAYLLFFPTPPLQTLSPSDCLFYFFHAFYLA